MFPLFGGSEPLVPRRRAAIHLVKHTHAEIPTVNHHQSTSTPRIDCSIGIRNYFPPILRGTYEIIRYQQLLLLSEKRQVILDPAPADRPPPIYPRLTTPLVYVKRARSPQERRLALGTRGLGLRKRFSS